LREHHVVHGQSGIDQTGPLKVGIVFPGGIATNILGNSGVSMRGLGGADAAGKLPSAEDASRQIIEAVESGAARVTIGKDARMLDRIGRLMPARAIPMIARKMKHLVS
jgi:short-subunit dehydrogenase